jgi:2-desacetyl-2-hydroxyethyl bacteriochlorophyllide A dehydrogenase
MNSLVCSVPGLFEYKKTGEPGLKPGHSIIKIKRIGVCGTDLHAYEGTQPFFKYPRILGHELAGEIVETQSPNGFEAGEAVTIIPYYYCGHCIACRSGKSNCCVSMKVCGVHVDGGMVEYLQVPDDALVHADGLDYDELAMAEPFAIGAHGIRRASITPSEFVLVVGAGPIGLGTMEFARIAGARVIAMDVNEKRLRFCRDKLKVSHTVLAGGYDTIGELKEITNGDMPTVVIDATGNKKAITRGIDYLAHGGRYTLIGLQKENIIIPHPEFHKRETSLLGSRNATRKDFEQVIGAMREKKIDPHSFITHRVPFGKVKQVFDSWLDPASEVIKPMIEMA